MKFLKFEINSIIYLSIIITTIIGWVVFEFYHRQNDLDIDPALIEASQDPLPSGYNEVVLKEFYKSKDKFYEVQKN